MRQRALVRVRPGVPREWYPYRDRQLSICAPPTPGLRLLLARLFLGLSLSRAMSRDFCSNWMLWALTMARISPGKRFSSSAQRDVLCISTPIRSLRINPASRSALKCCESVDLGIVFSLTFRKLEQLREQAEPTMSE